MNLTAGTGFVPTAQHPKPSSGNDGIYLVGSSFIQAGTGNISLSAANEVQVGWSGTGNTSSGNAIVTTTRGGDIEVKTQYGDVDYRPKQPGVCVQHFPAHHFRALLLFRPPQLSVGISTAAGGDVTINAGGQRHQLYAEWDGVSTDAGSGAFGPQPGDVTITAGAVFSGITWWRMAWGQSSLAKMWAIPFKTWR